MGFNRKQYYMWVKPKLITGKYSSGQRLRRRTEERSRDWHIGGRPSKTRTTGSVSIGLWSQNGWLSNEVYLSPPRLHILSQGPCHQPPASAQRNGYLSHSTILVTEKMPITFSRQRRLFRPITPIKQQWESKKDLEDQESLSVFIKGSYICL
jgi:hypothetical protein